MKLLGKLISISLILVSTFAFSQNKYWVNGTGNWNDKNHWSTQSGGQAGAEIPTVNDNVVFDESSSSENYAEIYIENNIECKNFDSKNSNILFVSLREIILSANGNFFASKDGNLKEFYGNIIFENLTSL